MTDRRSVSPLITADGLARTLSYVRVCDIRWDLADPSSGRRGYEEGHIPGAVFVDLDTDLAGPPGVEGRHPLPGIDEFTETLGRLGIDETTDVVVYDDASGRIAARMWWMLRAIGHERVRLLDGGFQSWVASKGEVATGTEIATPRRYGGALAFTGVISHEEVADRPLIDARDGRRYRGEIEPIDPKPGHIPGAVNISTSRNLDDDGHFLSPEELASVYVDLPEDVAVSCGSGVTACHNALAMVSAGLEMPDIYVGSYSEWTRRGLPVVTGPKP